ncbi:MAG: LysR family transcriptional regulator [Veillonellales bacterium]
MEDRDWLIVRTLHQQKNITKTAQALFISQPAMTARLRHIETEFGVKIVQRTTKGVQFTPEGDFLAKSAAKILAEMRDIKNEVMNLSSAVAGTLTIGASNYLTTYTLPYLLRLFKQQHPNVEFKVTTTWSKDVFSLAYNQNVHVGFVSIDYGGFNEKHLLYEEPICIASVNQVNLEELPFLPRIDYQTDHLLKAQIDKWWRENFSHPPSVSMQVDKVATCKEMVRFGLGYAIMPSRICDDVQGIQKINLTDKTGNELTRKTWMIYNQESAAINLVRIFVDFVKNLTL